MADDKSIVNVAHNIAHPVYGPEKDAGRVIGTSFSVAMEVLVESIVRKFAMGQKQTIMRTAIKHMISQPFHGGLAPFGEKWTNAGDATYTQSFMDGAKGVPAVLFAQYIMNVFDRGFHIPAIDIKELLVTAGTKTITRPLMATVYKWLPKTVTDQLAVLDAIYNAQRDASNFGKGD
jgi:hypothetical protein